jgi:thioredoxin-related protein
MQIYFFSMIIIMLASSLSFADDKGTNFMKDSWDKVKQKAKEENKLIFVDAYTDWCGWCEVMDKNTFSDSTIAAFIHKHFIPAKFDMEKGDGLRLAMKYNVTGFPSFFVFNSDGRRIFTTVGYRPPEDFIKELEKSIDPQYWDDATGVSDIINLQYPDIYKRSYEKNEGGRRQWPDSTDIAEYFAQDRDWLTEINWLVMQRFKSGKEFDELFFDNIDKYYELFYDDDVNDRIYRILQKKLYEAAEQKSEDLLNDLIALAYKHLPERKEENVFFYRITYYEWTEDWDNYFKNVKSNVEKIGFDDHRKINDYCWNIYEKIDNEEYIKTAISWIEEVTKESTNWMYWDTYAALLYKDGNYLKAKEIAEKAIKMGKENNDKVEVTEELLEKIKAEINKQ